MATRVVDPASRFFDAANKATQANGRVVNSLARMKGPKSFKITSKGALGIVGIAVTAEQLLDFAGQGIVDGAFKDALSNIDNIAAGEQYVMMTEKSPESTLNNIADKYRPELEKLGVEFKPTEMTGVNGKQFIRDRVDFSGKNAAKNAQILLDVINQNSARAQVDISSHVINFEGRFQPGFRDKVSDVFNGENSEFNKSANKYVQGILDYAYAEGDRAGVYGAMEKLLQNPTLNQAGHDRQLVGAEDKKSMIDGLPDIGKGSILGTVIGLASTLIPGVGMFGLAIAAIGGGLGFMYDKSKNEHKNTAEEPSLLASGSPKAKDESSQETAMNIEVPTVPMKSVAALDKKTQAAGIVS